MPAALPKACARLGCGLARPCPEHDKPRVGQFHHLYNNARWRTRSRRFLNRHPRCGDRPGGLPPVMSECYEQQPRRIRASQQVDHVVPHKADMALFWDEQGNWQALCLSCGGRKSQAGL
jgi:5-methylcytosine-specific restriction protein A